MYKIFFRPRLLFNTWGYLVLTFIALQATARSSLCAKYSNNHKQIDLQQHQKKNQASIACTSNSSSTGMVIPRYASAMSKPSPVAADPLWLGGALKKKSSPLVRDSSEKLNKLCGTGAFDPC